MRAFIGIILYTIPAIIISTDTFSFSLFTSIMALITGFIGSILITLDLSAIFKKIKITALRLIVTILFPFALQGIAFLAFSLIHPIVSILLVLIPGIILLVLYMQLPYSERPAPNYDLTPYQLAAHIASHTVPQPIQNKVLKKESARIDPVLSNYKKIDDAIQKENEIKIKTTQSIKEMRKQSDKEISSLVKYTFIAGVIAILIFSFLVWKFFQGAILFKNSLLICTFFILPICTFCLGSNIQKEEKAFEIYEKTSNAEAEKEIFINYAKLISDIRATSIYEFCGIPSNVSLDEEGLPRDNLFSELKYGSFTRYHTNAECFHRVRGCSDAYDVTYLYDARFRACRKCAYEDIDIIPPKWFVYAQKLTTICKKYPEAFEHVLTQRKKQV